MILTALLLFVLAGVAAWATLSDGGLGRLFGTGENQPAATASAPEQTSDTPTETSVPITSSPDAAPVLQENPDVEENTTPAAEDLISSTDEVTPEPDELATTALATPAEAVNIAPGEVLSPAAADRFYAATGVWLRAPRLPLLPQSDSLGELSFAGQDASVVRSSADTLPSLGELAPDSTLPVQITPPPPDVAFPRDPRGLILATEAGTLTPYGMLIYAGSPAVVPPTRPNTIAPQQEATLPEATEPASDAQPSPTEAETSADDATLPISPEDALAALPASEQTEAPASDAVERVSTAGAVSLDGLRPPARPLDLAPQEAAPEPEQVAFAGPRPSLRPASIAPAPPPEEEEEIAEEAPAEPDVQSALAAIVASAPDPLATATPQAVARASRPDARPQNFSRVVSQAQTRAAREQPAASAPQPETVSSAAAQPTGPVSSSVASAATTDNAINLRNVNLIGVYGRPNDRRALVRLGNGRYVRVGVGDSLDGGQVAAIGDNSLNYVKRGRTVTLQIPSG
ncbi:hypothetical protein [Flavimaricola marinus]|uniref:hypothetical protein n=1 Tax=Flavimaricola marinus TaxID=1819565 RepID=UPI0010550390|nr:hypothetical protein [Flavimaricola marinus]